MRIEPSKIATLWLAALLSILTRPALATSLDQQFAGLAHCRVENVYLDPNDHQPRGAYFSERQLQPCELDEAARYCIEDSYQGLPVSAVLIPYQGPFSVHALYLKNSVEEVRARLGREFFGDGRQRPLLVADRQHPEHSVLYCDPESQ